MFFLMKSESPMPIFFFFSSVDPAFKRSKQCRLCLHLNAYFTQNSQKEPFNIDGVKASLFLLTKALPYVILGPPLSSSV